MLAPINALTLVILLAVGTDATQSPNWQQFRGPAGSGVAEAEHPPMEIGPDKNVQWKVAAPSGASSPIVVGDKLVLTAFENGKLYTIAYHRADGSEAWRAHAPAKELEPYHKTEGSPAASTPASDGERIVSYFGSCGLFCYDLAGHELWRHEMPTAKTLADFGTGVSPILADGKVVLLHDDMTDPKIFALDAATGKLLWEQPRQSKSGFGTPGRLGHARGKANRRSRLRQDDRLRFGHRPRGLDRERACPRRPAPRRSWSTACSTMPAGRRAIRRIPASKCRSFDELLANNNADANGDGIFSKAEVRRARCSKTSSTTTTRTRTA